MSVCLNSYICNVLCQSNSNGRYAFVIKISFTSTAKETEHFLGYCVHCFHNDNRPSTRIYLPSYYAQICYITDIKRRLQDICKHRENPHPEEGKLCKQQTIKQIYKQNKQNITEEKTPHTHSTTTPPLPPPHPAPPPPLPNSTQEKEAPPPSPPKSQTDVKVMQTARLLLCLDVLTCD